MAINNSVHYQALFNISRSNVQGQQVNALFLVTHVLTRVTDLNLLYDNYEIVMSYELRPLITVRIMKHIFRKIGI